MDKHIPLEEIRAQVETLRTLDRERRECNSRDHSKGFCGERCFTLTSHTRLDIFTNAIPGYAEVRVTHTPTGISHSHSTKDYSVYMAKYLCLDKIAEELKYRFE